MKPETPAIRSVTEVTRMIREVLETSFPTLWIRGEISNFSQPVSGHIYFSLKDSAAEIKCVMFRGYNRLLHFQPQNGMDVLVQGRISVYEQRGQYQLLVQTMEPAGIGTLFLAFEALKKQLAKEGLFDEQYKQPLPRFPACVGVITSGTGAAWRDILNVLNRRCPQVRVILRPAQVQGEESADDLVQALKEIDTLEAVDVIILGRGGGSLEDLWSFNEEKVARAIFKCSTPVISAVGHETDITISDLVADLRAPTPSAAAELVAPSLMELNDLIRAQLVRLSDLIHRKLEIYWQQLDTLSERYGFQQPGYLLEKYLEKTSSLTDQLRVQMEHRLELAHSRYQGMVKELEALDPLKILHRGYSVAMKDNGSIVKAERDLERGESFTLRTGDGSFRAKKGKTVVPSAK